MKARQLSIHAQNKPGIISGITSALREVRVNIRAMTISSHGPDGIINVMVDDPKTGKKALEKKGIKAEYLDVIAVLIDDKPGGLDDLVSIFFEANINIENAYGFVLESRKHAVFVVEVDKIDDAVKLLKKHNFKTLSEESLSEIEPFHYMKY